MTSALEPATRMAIGHIGEAIRYAEQLPEDEPLRWVVRALSNLDCAEECLREYATAQEIALQESMKT